MNLRNLTKIKTRHHMIPVEDENFHSLLKFLKFMFLSLHRSLILSNVSEIDNKNICLQGKEKTQLQDFSSLRDIKCNRKVQLT